MSVDCKYHSPAFPLSRLVQDETMLEALPPNLISAVTQTITTVTECILQTFSYSYWKPFIPPDTNSFEKVNMPGVPADDETFAIILWNDEVHSFDDVIGAVSEALAVTRDNARAVAESVDAEVITCYTCHFAQ